PIPDETAIRFPKALPFGLFTPIRASTIRPAIVAVDECCDCHAAIEEGRRLLTRYLHSTRLDHLRFDRTISPWAVTKETVGGATRYVEADRRLQDRQLFNDEGFYHLSADDRNRQTFVALDRILYWLEQARRSADETQLIALWTAMEFLFSMPNRETV